MKRNFARLLVALLILPTLASCAVPDEISMINCTEKVNRPSEIVTYCADAGQIIQNIKWSIWNEDHAIGTGVAYTNLCEPNCAEGEVVANSVDITLNAPEDTNEGLLFTSLELKYLEPLKNHPQVETFELPTELLGG